MRSGGPHRREAKLHARARARRRRARADVERDTALPPDLFDCQEPMVEAALIDAAARVFLDKLGHVIEPAAPAAPAVMEPAMPANEIVDPASIAACLRKFGQLDDVAAPDLTHGLDDERLWVLLDLARHGTGVSRQRATHELRQQLRELCAQAAERQPLLLDLAEQLERAIDAGFPVVFRALLLEVQAGLARLVATAAPEGTR